MKNAKVLHQPPPGDSLPRRFSRSIYFASLFFDRRYTSRLWRHWLSTGRFAQRFEFSAGAAGVYPAVASPSRLAAAAITPVADELMTAPLYSFMGAILIIDSSRCQAAVTRRHRFNAIT